VRKIWGRPLGGKATLEIIRHQGTPKETRERQTLVIDRTHLLTVALDNGRRTTADYVPPPGSQPRPARPAVAGVQETLTRLRNLAMPDHSGVEVGTRSGLAGVGVSVPSRDAARPTGRAAADGAAYQTRVTPYLPGGTDFTVEAGLSTEHGQLRLRLNPVFQSVRPTGVPAFSSPLIPGGADPLAQR